MSQSQAIILTDKLDSAIADLQRVADELGGNEAIERAMDTLWDVRMVLEAHRRRGIRAHIEAMTPAERIEVLGRAEGRERLEIEAEIARCGQ